MERYCCAEGFAYSKGRRQPLILHADNGNAMRAATLESRLEELGVLRSFSRPRVSNDNPYSESLFRTARYRPDCPRRPFASKDEACQWVVAFVDWYNHQHRHSGIKFVTPQQRHCGQAVEISHHRTVLYEQARQLNLELPQFGGQISGPRGGECTGSDELLFVVDWAEIADR